MNRDEIQQRIRHLHLERLAEEIDRRMLPGIRLQAQVVSGDVLPLGSSKLGGQPDLPPGIDWPVWKGTPLAFLGQFRLPELSEFDVDGSLPGDGLLYFFYEAESQPWGGVPDDRGGWQVFYHTGSADALYRHNLPTTLPQYSQLAPHHIGYEVVVTVPDLDVIEQEAGLSEDEVTEYFRLESEANKYTHQLLGHPASIQGPMHLWCELCSGGHSFDEVLGPDSRLTPAGKELQSVAFQNWRLLLRLDALQTTSFSIKGKPLRQDWALGGLIYFWIRGDALARCDFSNVWFQLQTT
ncbi:MAG TPA: YwqG family protein [Ktedonobacterales bacterium]